MIEKTSEASMVIIFAVYAFEDLRKGEISLAMIILGSALGIGFRIASGNISAADILPGLLPAAILALAGFSGKDMVGPGDALMALTAVSFLGWRKNMVFIMASSIICAACSLLLICTGKIRLKGSVPFAPFMLAGMVAMEAIC